MSAPIANFNYYVNFLGVSFVDMSQNLPSSFSWDFGDTNSSTLENPTHTYTTPGSYTVVLSVSNIDGSSTISYTVEVSNQPAFGFTIAQLITNNLSSLIVANPTFENEKIKYWQLYLQNSIDPHISDAFVFNEAYWPNLVNILISKLVIYEYYTKLAKDALVSALSTGSASTTSSSGSGGLKSLETGPAKAEWYNKTDTLSSIFKPSGENGDSVFAELLRDICMLSSKIRIKLPICKELSHNPIVPQKVKAPQIFPSTVYQVMSIYGWT